MSWHAIIHVSLLASESYSFGVVSGEEIKLLPGSSGHAASGFSWESKDLRHSPVRGEFGGELKGCVAGAILKILRKRQIVLGIAHTTLLDEEDKIYINR